MSDVRIVEEFTVSHKWYIINCVIMTVKIKIDNSCLPRIIAQSNQLSFHNSATARSILRTAELHKKNPEAFHIGEILTEYDSRELMLMASYLWNEGRSSLTEEERVEAHALLEKWEATENQPTKHSAVIS